MLHTDRVLGEAGGPICNADVDPLSTNNVTMVLVFDDLVLTVIVRESSSRMLILYDMYDKTVSEEILVVPTNVGYITTVLLDGHVVFTGTKDVNILEPISSLTLYADVQTQRPGPYDAHYLYKWWDGIQFVIGPSWQVKYPHPDREYNHIPPFSYWTGVGIKLLHHQIDSTTSAMLAGVGWAALFAAVGAYIGESTGSVYGAVIGAVVGTVFGILFGYYTQAILCDEAGCIWWWSSRSFEEWLAANALWIYILSLTPGGATGFVVSGFAAYGYLRIGSYTFYDAVGAGSP